MFGSYFIPAFGFSFILLFPYLAFLKVINFQMWLVKSRATSWVTLSKRKSNSFQESPTKHKQLLIRAACKLWPSATIRATTNNYSTSSSRTWADSQRGAERLVGYQLITTRRLTLVLLYTPYLVTFLCFLGLLFQEERQFMPRSARQTSPPSWISLHIGYELRS